jgi:hypothetical protein
MSKSKLFIVSSIFTTTAAHGVNIFLLTAGGDKVPLFTKEFRVKNAYLRN